MGIKSALRLPACLLVCLAALAGTAPRVCAQLPDLLAAAKKADAPIDIHADRYDFEGATGLATGVGHVRVNYQDISLSCDELKFNNASKQIAAKGHVILVRGTMVWNCDEVSGNLGTRQFDIGRYEAKSDLIYFSGKSGKYVDKDQAALDGSVFTSCDYTAEPHYTLSATRITYQPNGEFTARNVVFRVGSLPVFYMPVLWGSTTTRGGITEIRPGYSGKYGAFLLMAKSFQLSKEVTTKFRLDLRSKNGVAVGNETTIKTDKTRTDILLYGMHDSNAPDTGDGWNRRFDVVQDRYRARVYQRVDFMDSLAYRLNLDKLSDIDMLENWYKKEYRNDPQPKSFTDVTWDQDRFSLSLSARPRLNDFYSEVEELPSLKLTLPRQNLGETGAYYQGETSIADKKMKWREFDKPRTDLDPTLTDNADYEATRVDSLHMFYYPLQLGGFEFVPRAGGRATWYSNSSKRDITVQDLNDMAAVDDPDNTKSLLAINSYDDDGGSVLRLAAEAGFEVSTKYYRTWSDYRSTKWDIDGLRHVVQPYLNYTYAPPPTEDRENLYFFDEVDRLIEQNFVRLGLRQRWETRRSNRIYTLASMENYADFHFVKEEGFKNLGNFGTRFNYDPTDKLRFWGNVLADMGEPDLNRFQIGTGFGNKKVLRTDVSYLYRNNYDARTVYSMGSSLTDIAGDSVFSRHFDRCHYIVVGFTFPINAKMDGLVRYEFDIVNTRLARQVYEIQRDLHCWKGAFRIEEEDGDLSFILALYLKADDGVGINAGI